MLLLVKYVTVSIAAIAIGKARQIYVTFNAFETFDHSYIMIYR